MILLSSNADLESSCSEKFKSKERTELFREIGSMFLFSELSNLGLASSHLEAEQCNSILARTVCKWFRCWRSLSGIGIQWHHLLFGIGVGQN